MATSAPSAITQFLAISTAALPNDFYIKFDTIFGPYVPPMSILVTGVTFTEDEIAVLGPNYEHEERYNLICQVASSAGDNDEATRLAEVYAVYEQVAVAVANNPTLNGAVRVATTRQLDYSPTHDLNAKSVGILNFEVECQQRVASLI